MNGTLRILARVVVVDRHRQDFLGLFLLYDILVKNLLYLGGLEDLPVALFFAFLAVFLAYNFVAELDALVADIDGGAGNEFLDLILAFAAEGAQEVVIGIVVFAHGPYPPLIL